jgi:predicted RNA binding protein YcfA (HicA-like mRNA interferase family)
MKGREFIRRLKRLGVRIDTKRGKGGHALATFNDRQTVVSMHGDADMPPFLLKKICRQLGLDPDDVL